jgi:hypothetical protein
LAGGLRPAGDVLQWLGRLLTIAVAIPVLEMAAIAAVTGAFWLRFRAPVRDRDALGVLGNPAVAIVFGGLLIVVGFVLQPVISTWWWLLCLVALDVVALLWLRRVIHLGLLEEALEEPIAGPITCANCGETTARHAFCTSCGISLQALPKRRPDAGGPAPGSQPAEGTT